LARLSASPALVAFFPPSSPLRPLGAVLFLGCLLLGVLLLKLAAPSGFGAARTLLRLNAIARSFDCVAAAAAPTSVPGLRLSFASLAFGLLFLLPPSAQLLLLVLFVDLLLLFLQPSAAQVLLLALFVDLLLLFLQPSSAQLLLLALFVDLLLLFLQPSAQLLLPALLVDWLLLFLAPS
jgi:hypothetical protein